jgi:hypothetical protein
VYTFLYCIDLFEESITLTLSLFLIDAYANELKFQIEAAELINLRRIRSKAGVEISVDVSDNVS